MKESRKFKKQKQNKNTARPKVTEVKQLLDERGWQSHSRLLLDLNKHS